MTCPYHNKNYHHHHHQPYPLSQYLIPYPLPLPPIADTWMPVLLSSAPIPCLLSPVPNPLSLYPTPNPLPPPPFADTWTPVLLSSTPIPCPSPPIPLLTPLPILYLHPLSQIRGRLLSSPLLGRGAHFQTVGRRAGRLPLEPGADGRGRHGQCCECGGRGYVGVPGAGGWVGVSVGVTVDG